MINFQTMQYASYAVSTPDHFLPLIYLSGATKGEKPRIFNDKSELGTIAMTGFEFGI